jgi:hypothetical protein
MAALAPASSYPSTTTGDESSTICSISASNTPEQGQQYMATLYQTHRYCVQQLSSSSTPPNEYGYQQTIHCLSSETLWVIESWSQESNWSSPPMANGTLVLETCVSKRMIRITQVVSGATAHSAPARDSPDVFMGTSDS